MTTRHVRSAVVASALTFGMVGLAPTLGRAQNTPDLPLGGQRITVVGCLINAKVKGHPEKLVLAKATAGVATSVPEATCTASDTDPLIRLEDMGQVGLNEAFVGRWMEISGRLESQHRVHKVREIHVKSFRPVPVVVPPPAVAMIAPAPEAPPAVEVPPAPQIAENNWTPPPMPTPAPVGTSGHRKSLPKTATNVPFFGLIGFLSIAAGFTLHLFNRRDVEHV